MADPPLLDEPVEPEGDEPLTAEEYAGYLDQLRDDVWEVVDDRLEGTYSFDDFEGALAFTNEAGELAEDAWHHPDLHLSWGEVGVELTTHDVGGLTRADFALAVRLDQVYGE